MRTAFMLVVLVVLVALLLAGCATAGGGRGVCVPSLAKGSGTISLMAGTVASMIANGPLGGMFWPVAVPAAAVALATDFAPACATVESGSTAPAPAATRPDAPFEQ